MKGPGDVRTDEGALENLKWMCEETRQPVGDILCNMFKALRGMEPEANAEDLYLKCLERLIGK